MTNKEFKAWFEGFTEALSGTPTKAQWARIKERVAEIDGESITERVFIDRWYNRYPLYWQSYGTGACGGSSISLTNATTSFADSAGAMYAAGKAEASHS